MLLYSPKRLANKYTPSARNSTSFLPVDLLFARATSLAATVVNPRILELLELLYVHPLRSVPFSTDLRDCVCAVCRCFLF